MLVELNAKESLVARIAAQRYAEEGEKLAKKQEDLGVFAPDLDNSIAAAKAVAEKLRDQRSLPLTPIEAEAARMDEQLREEAARLARTVRDALAILDEPYPCPGEDASEDYEAVCTKESLKRLDDVRELLDAVRVHVQAPAPVVEEAAHAGADELGMTPLADALDESAAAPPAASVA